MASSREYKSLYVRIDNRGIASYSAFIVHLHIPPRKDGWRLAEFKLSEDTDKEAELSLWIITDMEDINHTTWGFNSFLNALRYLNEQLEQISNRGVTDVKILRYEFYRFLEIDPLKYNS